MPADPQPNTPINRIVIELLGCGVWAWISINITRCMLYYALCELDCGVRYITRPGYNRFARELPSLGATLNYIKLDLKVAAISARLQFPSICSDLLECRHGESGTDSQHLIRIPNPTAIPNVH